MNNAITTIEEVGIRKDAALGNQEKLNEYFELALSGRINITRDSITSLLEQFSFTEEEQREAAKILMFPEDALFTYDEKIKSKEKSGKSIGEVLQEAKTASLEKEEIMEEKEEIVEEKVIDPKEEVIETLKEQGIDYLDFKADEIDELIANFEKETIVKNIKFIKNKEIGIDIFHSNIKLIYDGELEEKITMLEQTGKTLTDIYLNPNVLVKYNRQGLENAIGSIKANGLAPQDVPLMAY